MEYPELEGTYWDHQIHVNECENSYPQGEDRS